jgi:ABC-2 type transport system permease protein
MKRPAKPGFLLVAGREWRWLLHDRAALILIFGVPLFAFVTLTAVFSHPVIRGLGVVVVDADRSDTSRAFVEQVAAAPGLSIVERAGDLASAAWSIRSGEAIGAVYVPADFERDLKAERRPQVIAFYNQQFLTAAGIASSNLSDSLAAAASGAAARTAPKPARIGALVAETIVLVNPEKNYAQFLLRALLPMVLHVVIGIAAGYAVGSEFRRRSMRSWLACAGGNPIVALTGKLAPMFGIFFLMMLSMPLLLEGWLQVPFKGDVPMMAIAASLLIVAYLAIGALFQLLVRDLATGLGLTGLVVSPAFGYAGVGFPALGMNAFALFWGAILPLRWYMAVLLGQAARGLPLSDSAGPFAALAALTILYTLFAFLRLRSIAASTSRAAGTGGGACCTSRHRRSFLRGVAACARDARSLPPAGRGAAGVRRLLPAALPQPDSAQDPDRGRRQRPERAQPRDRANAGRERRGQGGGPCRYARRGACGARPR